MNTFTFCATPRKTKVDPWLAKKSMGRTVPTWRGHIEDPPAFDGMMREERERRTSAFSLVGKETLRVILKVKVFYVRSPCWLHGRIHPTAIQRNGSGRNAAIG
jgi:hypothetical protein